MRDYSEVEKEVLAAIGLWALRDMQGQPERAQAMFEALQKRFDGRYPEHKILSHFRAEASEPKDVTDEGDQHPSLAQPC